jgi:high-affinity iron transporter
MLAALVIVFREVIEAGLVTGIVLAATRGVKGRGLMVGCGVLAGALGACLVAAFASRLEAMLSGNGQEIFNVAILVLAVLMLAWHNIWMASHGREIAREMRAVGAEVSGGRRPLAALGIVVGVAVLREGSEIVLFLYGIIIAGGNSVASMTVGGLLGVAGGVLLSALMYFGLLKIPARHLFSVTGAMITLLAAGMAAQAVAILEQAGMLDIGSRTAWDTSSFLSVNSIPGRMLHALIGYTDRPSDLQVVVYVLTIVAISGLAKLAARMGAKPVASAAAA